MIGVLGVKWARVYEVIISVHQCCVKWNFQYEIR